MLDAAERPLAADAPQPAGEAVIDAIIHLYKVAGRRDTTVDGLSQVDHAVQTAQLAEDERAPESLVVAALLHDLGHLLEPWPRDIAHLGVDHRHEALGAAWLARAFGPEVCEPIRLHVQAKRYLCTVEESYLETLTPSAMRSLELQGGPMGAADARAFEGARWFREAVWLSRLDERAKRGGMSPPDFEEYRARLEAMLPYALRG